MDSLAIELRASKEFAKLEAGIKLLGSIASVSEPISKQAFSQLLSFLAHRYPKVHVTCLYRIPNSVLCSFWLHDTLLCFDLIQIRKEAAVEAHLALLQNSILVTEDKIEKVEDIITNSYWDADMESTKLQRLELCELIGLDHGVVFRTRNRTLTKGIAITASDENAAYSALVDSSGF